MEFSIILDYLDLHKGEKVCDLGCGDGRNGVLLSLPGTRIYGVDVGTDELHWAKENAHRLQLDAYYCLSDLNNALCFKRQSFDKAVSNWVLHHLSNPENALNEVNKALRPQGVFALSVDSFAYGNAPSELVSTHKEVCQIERYYNIREICLLLDKCDFSVEKCSYVIRSSISKALYETLLRLYFRSEIRGKPYFLSLFKLLTPMVLVMCMISDSFYDDKNDGYCVAVRAVKKKGLT